MGQLVPFQPKSLARSTQSPWLQLIAPNTPPDPSRYTAILAAIHSTRITTALQIRIQPGSFEVGIKAHQDYLRTLATAISGADPDLSVVLAQPAPRRGSQACLGWLDRAPMWAPLRTLARTETVDVLHALFEAVQELRATEHALVHFLVRPASRELKTAVFEAITEVVPPKDQYEALARLLHGDEAAPRRPRFEARQYRPLEERLRQPCFEVLPVIAVFGDDRRRLLAKAHRLENVLSSFPDAGYGGFRFGPWGFGASSQTLPTAWPAGVTGHAISVPELGAIFHPASSLVRAPGVAHLKRPNQPLPIAVAHASGLVIGQHNQPGKQPIVRVPIADFRAGPTLVCGKTGMGKSVWLRQLIHQLAALPSRPTIVVIDSHDLAPRVVLDSIPAQREQDVILFDAADTDHPYSLSPFLAPAGLSADLRSQHVFGLVNSLFPEFSAHARMQDLLFTVLSTLVAQPAATLLDLERLLFDPGFRTQALRHVTDPLVLAAWARYDRLSPSNQLERAEPIGYRLRALTRSPAVRNLVCQPRSYDLTTLLDRGSILLYSLAGEAVKAEAMTLGNLIITALHMALTARLQRPQNELRPVYLVIDEAHRYDAASLMNLLTELRKASLTVICATQYLDKWSDQMTHAVLGNLSTLIAFKSNPADAYRLKALLAPFSADDLLTLDRFEALASFHVNDEAQPAIDIRSLPIDRPEDPERLHRIRAQTRQRFCQPRAEVEAELLAQLASPQSASTPSSPSVPPLWQRQDIEEE
jgi:hypothetical protein